jgi:hypothetical protein
VNFNVNLKLFLRQFIIGGIIVTEKRKYLEKNMPKCHIVHHKCRLGSIPVFRGERSVTNRLRRGTRHFALLLLVTVLWVCVYFYGGKILFYDFDGSHAISRETSEDFCQVTWPYIPHDADIHT